MFRIRGHTLLCLQGFQGKGYDDKFIANMKKIHETLFNDPTTEVEIVASPDDICSHCPYLIDNGCTLKGHESGKDVIEKDNSVIEFLGFKPSGRHKWEEILQRISETVNASMLIGLCDKCPWFPLGYCEEGILRLKRLTDSHC